MRRASDSFQNFLSYTSPEYSSNNHGDDDLPKTWSSERVPFSSASSSSSNITRRPQVMMIPFNNGKSFPSKWDDAERWITSPIPGYGVFKNHNPQPRRRPMSKSGPLGQTGVVCLSSPKTFTANSPLTTGVLVSDGVSITYDRGFGVKSAPFDDEGSLMRSVSVPGFSDMLSESSLPSSPGKLSTADDKVEGTMEEEEEEEEESLIVSRDVSRRDMATQMSPEAVSIRSSSSKLSFSALALSPIAVKDHQVRDVEIDQSTTTTAAEQQRQSKKGSRKFELITSPWKVSEALKNTSRSQREEAKITAWENLQKAKAEAALRKLEMKLEQKRSAGMDKIMNKLKSSQMKAQTMRDLLSISDQPSSRKIPTYIKTCSFSICFLCSGS